MGFNPEKITKLTDKELLRALLLREEYLPVARNIIIGEAIERKLIQSESDLQKPGLEAIKLSKHHFFQFSVIASVSDARHICDLVKKYFYFVSLGFGGLFAVYKIVGDSLQMWANLAFMLGSILLALLFHRFKNYAVAVAFLILNSISAVFAIWSLFVHPIYISAPGLMLNFILFYFAIEAFFATQFLVNRRQQVDVLSQWELEEGQKTKD